MEIAVVIDIDNNPICWHEPAGSTAASIPDSRDLWSVLQDRCEVIEGVAHSHPGSGPTAPSGTDVTTFSAIERGLGRRFQWWITTTDQLFVYEWCGPGLYDYAGERVVGVLEGSPWVRELRRKSAS